VPLLDIPMDTRLAMARAQLRATQPGTRQGSRTAPPPLLSCAIAFAMVPHHALTAGTILRLVLLAIAALVIYVLIVLASPTKRCGKCHGNRVTMPKPRKNGKPRGKPKPCQRCKVTGRHYRLGATAIHRTKWSIVNGRHHTKLEEKS
jgi:hypothetical protein